MKERPILFSAPMVRALLDGRKTMTRRVVKPQPGLVFHGVPFVRAHGIGEEPEPIKCPYGQPGDRLWVRETFAEFDGGGVARTIYRADDNDGTREIDKVKGWRPSIFMPRSRSRITLEVTGVRVERVQEISEEDVLAEGCELSAPRHAGGHEGVSRWWNYRVLWDSINGTGAWDANPWVWVVKFRKLEGGAQ